MNRRALFRGLFGAAFAVPAATIASSAGANARASGIAEAVAQLDAKIAAGFDAWRRNEMPRAVDIAVSDPINLSSGPSLLAYPDLMSGK